MVKEDKKQEFWNEIGRGHDRDIEVKSKLKDVSGYIRNNNSEENRYYAIVDDKYLGEDVLYSKRGRVEVYAKNYQYAAEIFNDYLKEKDLDDRYKLKRVVKIT